MLDLVAWYLLISFLGFLVLPLAYRLFPRLADRGYTLSRALGLLLWGFIFWLLCSFGLLPNNIGGVLASLILLAASSFWLGRGRIGFKEVVTFQRQRLRQVVIAEALFLAAFIFAALMRAGNPEIAYTEKPMELAFINAILRSPQFPPSDPWLSGYAISYYYFGYIMVAMFIRVTGVTSGIGFNLAHAMLFALTAIGAYGVVFNLLAPWSRRRQAEGKPGFFSQGWALLSPLFILIISNVEGLLEILHSGGAFWEQTGGQLRSSFWSWLAMPDLINAPAQPFSWLAYRPGWWWWRASRVIQDYDLAGGYHEVIDEFPFFSYFLADLHPHVLAMPFVLLAIAFALNFYFWISSQNASKFAFRNWVRTPEFWFSGIIIGGLSFLNTWDFPIYLALFCAVYAMARFQQTGWNWRNQIKDFLTPFVFVGSAGMVLYLPFYIGFASQAGGILPSLAFFSRGVHFWIMFAPLMVPIFVFLAWLWSSRGGKKSLASGAIFGAAIICFLWIFSFLLGWLGSSLPALGQALSGDSGTGILSGLGRNFIQWGALFGGLQGATNTGTLLVGALMARLAAPGTWLTLLVMITLVWGLFSTYKPQENDADIEVILQDPVARTTKMGSPVVFLLLLIFVGAGLALVPEFVYLRDQFGGRMNTIFKFYFQTWIVWGLAAAALSAILWVELKAVSKLVFGLVWLFFLGAGLVYPFFGIAERFQPDRINSWTLDGTAFMEKANPSEMLAINWLSQAPVGNLVEAVGGQYSDYARVSMLSGLPAVLGWPGHEAQWRGGAREIGSRESDIDRLYRTTEWNEALSVIQRYKIRYIFIGNLERTKYKVNESKFKAHAILAYSNNDTNIYEIPENLLITN